MRKRWKAIAVVLLLLLSCVGVWGAPAIAGGDELGYWDRFKMLFIDWDDNAAPGSARTEVTGVRGLNVEEKLGKKGYDWEAVQYMEEFQVPMDQEKAFLQEGGLGPFQSRQEAP